MGLLLVAIETFLLTYVLMLMIGIINSGDVINIKVIMPMAIKIALVCTALTSLGHVLEINPQVPVIMCGLILLLLFVLGYIERAKLTKRGVRK